MFNLFGKIGSEYKDEGFLRDFWGELAFSEFKTCIRTRKRNNTAAEILADKILEEVKKSQDFQSLTRLGLAENSNVIQALLFDLKFLMIASGYYERLNNAPAFPSTTNYYKCLNPSFTFRVKRKDIHKNNNNQYPLKQFILTPGAHNLERLSNFMDLGLIIGLMDSYSGGINPYIHPKKSRPFKPFDFLQTFKYAYIYESNVIDLLTDKVKTLPIEKTEYGDRPLNSDKTISAQAESLENTINPQIYAVLNQYFIERLTNLNFIISLYDYKENYTDKTNIYQEEGQLLSMLSLPLPHFRLAVLNTLKEPGAKLYTGNFSESVQLLEEHLIPLVCGTYLTVAKSDSFHIGKDEPFLKDLYADPRKNNPDNGQQACQLFKLNNKGQIYPVEKFHINSKTHLKIEELDELDSNYFDHAIKAARSDSFETILESIILPAYKTESSRYVPKRIIQKLDDAGKNLFKSYLNLEPSFVPPNPPEEQFAADYKAFTKLYNKEADKLAAESKMCADIQHFIEQLGGYAVPGTNTITVKDCKAFMKFSCNLLYYLKHSGQSNDFSSYARNLITAFDNRTLDSFWNRSEDSFFKARATKFDDLMDNMKRLKGLAIQNPDIYEILLRAYNQCYHQLQFTESKGNSLSMTPLKKYFVSHK